MPACHVGVDQLATGGICRLKGFQYFPHQGRATVNESTIYLNQSRPRREDSLGGCGIYNTADTNDRKVGRRMLPEFADHVMRKSRQWCATQAACLRSLGVTV